MTERVSVYIVDDHPAIRASVGAMLNRHEDLQVVGEAGDAETALDQVDGVADVVLVDLSLPGMGGLELLVRLRARDPDLALAVLSGHFEASYVRAALGAGASAYILKDDSAGLPEALRRAHRGEQYLSPELAELGLDPV